MTAERIHCYKTKQPLTHKKMINMEATPIAISKSRPKCVLFLFEAMFLRGTSGTIPANQMEPENSLIWEDGTPILNGHFRCLNWSNGANYLPYRNPLWGLCKGICTQSVAFYSTVPLFKRKKKDPENPWKSCWNFDPSFLRLNPLKSSFNFASSTWSSGDGVVKA